MSLRTLSQRTAPFRAPEDRHAAEIEAFSWRYGAGDAHTLAGYEAMDGYVGARKAVGMEPSEIIQLVKDAGVRGRGGAGFPTGLKWSFVAQGTGKPAYIVCNADESEPGTFKDRLLLELDPHSLVEGMICGGIAIQSETGVIYCRGEFGFVARRLQAAIKEAYEAGYLGENIFGSGKRFDLILHRGAAAYICGEETALLESLEGRRGQPRLRPPFPAAHGLYGCPTTVNNVETIITTPYLLRHGSQWYRQWGTEKSPGPKLMCISGEVVNPGNYEVGLGTKVSDMIEMAGGMLPGRELKFWCPGGSSTPYLTADHADVPYTFEAIAEAGSLLGTGALMLYSDRTSVVETTWRYVGFYKHESCGKCTPCREGGAWMHQILGRILRGQGRMEDLDLLSDICDNIFGRSFCALGDAATSPVAASIQYFRDEYVHLIEHGTLPDGVYRTTDPAYFDAPPVRSVATTGA